jgi:hypothetical protein
MNEGDYRQQEQTAVQDADEQPALAGRETNRNRVVHWLLVRGDRRQMVVMLSLIATTTYFALGFADFIGVTLSSLVATTFTSAVTGVFTIVAVTISINQLVLSRVIGSPSKIRDRIDSVEQFRSHVAANDPTLQVSPTMPADFLNALLRTLSSRVAELEVVKRAAHSSRTNDIEELQSTLQNICEQARKDLERSDYRLFRVLSPILTNEFSRHLNTAREIKAQSSELPAEQRESLERVIETLEEVNITRHYFKTLYIHEELATVSRLILLTGLPAVLVSIGIILLYSADTVYLGETALLVAVSVGLGIVLLPLNVLFAYGLRMGTIAKMTTTFGAFTPVDEMP